MQTYQASQSWEQKAEVVGAAEGHAPPTSDPVCVYVVCGQDWTAEKQPDTRQARRKHKQ